MSRRICLSLICFILCAGLLSACSLVSDPETEPVTEFPPVSTELSEPTGEPTAPETEPGTEPSVPTETETETETEEPATEPPVPPVELGDLEANGKELYTYGISGDTSELEELLAAYPNKLSIAAYSVDGRKALLYDTRSTHHSACTIKAGYILYLCKLLDSGAESPATKLVYEERHTFDGSGRVRHTEYGTEFTVEYLIQLVMSISDNTAYRMLLDHFGVYGYNLLMREVGAPSLYLGPDNMFSTYANAHDLLNVWQAVYNYLQSDAEYASLYRKSCTDTEHAYGALTLVDYSYSHKSGENLYRHLATNDAGIVWAEVPYLYCMLANINYTEEHQEELNAIMTCVHRLMKPDPGQSLPSEPDDPEPGEDPSALKSPYYFNDYLGVSKESILNWLSAHESDDYYLGTPFGNQLDGFNTESCMRPNGRFPDDPHMTCTGFVLDVLMQASGDRAEEIHRLAAGMVDACDENDWMEKKPIEYYRNEVNAFYWGAFLQNYLDGRIELTEFETIEDLLESRSANKGDLLYFIPDNTVWSYDDLGYMCDEFGNRIDCHIGFYWGEDGSGENLFWHSTVDGLNGYPMDQSAGAFNQIGPICPPSAYSSVLLVPLG